MTFREGGKLKPPCYKGFTLAEVLITLGIIGIIAALTLPTLVSNFQKKILENRYKKSVSIISQAILKTKAEMGVEKLAEYCAYYPYTDNGHEYLYAKECYTALYNNLIKLQNNSVSNTWHSNKFIRKDTIKTFNGQQTVTRGDLSARGNTIFFTNIMPDGSFINYTIMEGYLYVGVDTNGKQGPNKLGYDIFSFIVNPANDFLTARTTPRTVTDEELENIR